MSAGVDGDGAADGDLGARPGRRRRARRPPRSTDRLRHVAHIGVRTRRLRLRRSTAARPAEEFRVELTAPDGSTVDLGSGGRRAAGHRPGARLLPAGHPAPPPGRPRAAGATGADADRWLDIAQAFAGPPGAGRAARVTRTGCCGSATPRASTATGAPRCRRCSTAASSTCSPATTSPS